jgi:F-type H+-transporting ATPase subunit epsilon
MKTFDLEIMTPERTIFHAAVRSVTVPAEDGRLGVLAGHAPLLSVLQPGEVDITQEDGNVIIMAVTGGFLEVEDNRARILADGGERAEDIDLERAQAALERARERLRHREDPDLDVRRAEVALRRAISRVQVVGKRDRMPGRHR